MTWHTSEGDRYLKGAEARLFRAGLRAVIEAIEDNAYDFEHTMLHRQSRRSLLHLFTYVGTHLLRPTEELAPLNAYTEGAVGIVFAAINGELEDELDSYGDEQSEHSHRWRQMIDAANQEAMAGEEEPLFEEDDADPADEDDADYEGHVEVLEEQILWDTDWAISTDTDRTLAESHLDYFAWCTTSTMTTEEAINTLGDLCGYRRGEFEGIDFL